MAYNDAAEKMNGNDIECVEIADMDTDQDGDEDRTLDYRISKLRKHITDEALNFNGFRK